MNFDDTQATAQPRTTLLAAARKAAGASAVLAGLLIAPAAAQAAPVYQSPFTGDSYTIGRTDMGVDVCLKAGEPIRAVGNGVVVGVLHNWYEGQPYIWYRLTNGPDAGHYVYVAEQITSLAAVGKTLHTGDVVARFASSGTCIETGWSGSSGWTTAQLTTGYKEGQVTTAGVSFARFLMSLGARGRFEVGTGVYANGSGVNTTPSATTTPTTKTTKPTTPTTKPTTPTTKPTTPTTKPTTPTTKPTTPTTKPTTPTTKPTTPTTKPTTTPAPNPNWAWHRDHRWRGRHRRP